MIEPGFSNGRQYFARYATMRDWIAVGFRRRKIVLTCFCGVFLGAVAFAWFWAANYFESSMDILGGTGPLRPRHFLRAKRRDSHQHRGHARSNQLRGRAPPGLGQPQLPFFVRRSRLFQSRAVMNESDNASGMDLCESICGERFLLQLIASADMPCVFSHMIIVPTASGS